jgi:hypothetical protein
LYLQELKRNPSAKLDQVRLIGSYEHVLKDHGVDPLTDGFYYRLLMKIENSKDDLFKALDDYISKNNETVIANQHHQKCLLAKSFFSLIANMVQSKSSSTATLKSE